VSPVLGNLEVFISQPAIRSSRGRDCLKGPQSAVSRLRSRHDVWGLSSFPPQAPAAGLAPRSPPLQVFSSSGHPCGYLGTLFSPTGRGPARNRARVMTLGRSVPRRSRSERGCSCFSAAQHFDCRFVLVCAGDPLRHPFTLSRFRRFKRHRQSPARLPLGRGSSPRPTPPTGRYFSARFATNLRALSVVEPEGRSRMPM